MSALLLAALLSGSRQAEILDDFSSLSNYRAISAEDVGVRLSQEPGRSGQAMRIDLDFRGHGGYVLAERAFRRQLPANYEFSYWLKADLPDNNLEFKLMDPTGQYTYWHQRPGFHWPKQWTHVVIRKRQIRYAWGPKEIPLTETGTLQFGIGAARGGKGTVWIEDFRFRQLPKFAPFTGKFRALQGHVGGWQGGSLVLDLGVNCELGGLALSWAPGKVAASVAVETSDDGQSWRAAGVSEPLRSMRDVVFTPEGSGRYIRLTGRGNFRLSDLKLLPVESADSANSRLSTYANQLPEGLYPRHLRNQQGFWTIVGSNGGQNEGAISEDGQVELGRTLPSVDPFVVPDGGKTLTWANTHQELSLADGYLPMPRVLRKGPLDLSIEAFATNDGSEKLYADYRLTNRTNRTQSGKLVLAVRPIQVNPSWQALNNVGGVSRIGRIMATRNSLALDGERTVTFAGAADQAGAGRFCDGEIGRLLDAGRFFATQSTTDPDELASGALVYRYRLSPGKTARFAWRTSLTDRKDQGTLNLAEVDAARAKTRASWRKQLGQIELTLGGSTGRRVADLIRSNVAYILVNRDGPAIHPGSRNYARAWIRDGALMSAALLRFGRSSEVRDFLDYYSPFVRPDGYVPCIVDFRGPDRVPEHDSHGEYLYLLAEYYRITKDRTTLNRHFSTARRVADFIVRMLKANRKTEFASATGPERGFYGLMDPSISHEGYGQPEHSYWDDFMALKGLKDASEMAGIVGENGLAERYADEANQLRKDLTASIELSAKTHGKSYIPGCSEFGDFDPTSTSIAISPGGEQAYLPQDLLRGTFDAYWSFCNDRITGKNDWKDYTPYEMRSLSSFVRLGQPERALSLLGFFLHDVRPQAWNHWAEVVHREYRAPKYIGDMPHTWCGAEFLRSIRDFLVYESEGQTLTIGRGVSKEWLTGSGVSVSLPTAFGQLKLRATLDAKGAAIYRVSGAPASNRAIVYPPVGMGGKPVTVTLPATVKFG